MRPVRAPYCAHRHLQKSRFRSSELRLRPTTTDGCLARIDPGLEASPSASHRLTCVADPASDELRMLEESAEA